MVKSMTTEILAVGLSLVVLAGWGAAPDGSIIGCWKFDDSYGKRSSSEYANDIGSFGVNTSVIASGTAGNGYDGSGFLNIAGGGAQTMATLKDGVALDTSTSGGYTLVMRFKPNCSISMSGISKSSDPDIYQALSQINDSSKWHMMALVYDANKAAGGSCNYVLITDPSYGDGTGIGSGEGKDGRGEISSDNLPYFPLVVSGSTVTIGGRLGVSQREAEDGFKGYVDDVRIYNRILTKQELTRLFKTGDTYVYNRGSVDSFSNYSNWSSYSGSYTKGPAELPGADFLIDGEKTLTQSGTATFGGRSLTIGRLEQLYDRVGETNFTANLKGTLKIDGVSTSVTIADLRLNNGSITPNEDKEVLIATSLVISADDSAPFEVKVRSGKTFTIKSSAAAGSGQIKKTGNGALDMSGVTKNDSLLRVDMSVANANSILKAPTKGVSLTGFAGGKVVVRYSGSFKKIGTVHVEEGADVAWPMAVEANIANLPIGEHLLMEVPVSVKPDFSTSDVSLTLTGSPAEGQIAAAPLKVVADGQMRKAYVVCERLVDPEDVGDSPVLMIE